MTRRWEIKAAGVLALCGLSVFGCAKTAGTKKAETRKPAGPPLELKSVDVRVVAAGNEFGFDLLQRINAANKSANVLISPLSLSSSLAMTYNGASGQTQKEMAQTLRLGVLPLPTINAANAALRFNLATAIPNNDPRLEISIANSLWAKKSVSFDAGFLARNKQFYDAKVSSLDLSTPAAAEAMNAWAKQNTKGKIEKMFDAPPGAQARLILLNAVYFNGKWQSQFDANDTRNATFYLQNGSEKQVPMMSRAGDYKYAKEKNFAVVELPYGKGDLSLILILPDKQISLDSLLTKISTQNWDEWRSGMHEQEGTVSVPRFKMEFEIELQNTLQKMGMTSAFSASLANFKKMRAQNDLFLSQVKQKTFIEVNEKGTEAAAVTENEMATKAEMDGPFEFIADRPFFGAIYEKNSGAILFVMIVREP